MQAALLFLAQTLALIRKELLALLKDPANRTLLFAPALVQSLLFGYGATFDLTHAPYAVLDLSGGGSAREILARIDGTGVFKRVATLESPGQIAAQIDSGDALLVVAFPPDFESRLASGGGADAGDPRRPQLRHRRRGVRAGRRDRRRLQRGVARGHLAGHDRPPGLVQSELRVALEHDAGDDRLALDAADADDRRPLGRPRARAGHVRPASRHAAAPDADPDRQGVAGDLRRIGAVDDHPADHSLLVPHPDARLAAAALSRAADLHRRERRHRVVDLGGVAHDAAGDALHVHDHHALDVAVGAAHAGPQHAVDPAGRDLCQPASLRDRHRAARLSRGRDLRRCRAELRAAAGGGGGDAALAGWLFRNRLG